MQNKKHLIRAAAAAALAAGALLAHAQPAGTWYGGVAVTHIAPDVSSGTLSPPSAPNTRVDVGSDTRGTLFVGRMLTEHWAVEVPVAFGFKHEITGAGSINGVGRIGTIRALPITVFGQYRFLEANARLRPYVMLGLTYAHFYGERGTATLNAINPINPPGGTQLDVDSRFALTPGLGVSWMATERFFVDLQYAHSFLKTTTTLSTGQKIDTRLNPNAYRIGVGMRF